MFVTATYGRDGRVLIVCMSDTKIKYAILLYTRETLSLMLFWLGPIDFSWYEKDHSVPLWFLHTEVCTDQKNKI